jgi:hypothetical protein
MGVVFRAHDVKLQRREKVIVRLAESGWSTCACSDSVENAVVSTHGKTELGDGVFHDAFAIGSQHAVLADQAWAHLGIRINPQLIVFSNRKPLLSPETQQV